MAEIALKVALWAFKYTSCFTEMSTATKPNVLTVVNRIYTRKQQSAEERRNIFGKLGKNLWGIDGGSRRLVKGGHPAKSFASTAYGMFAVRKNL